MLREFGVKVVKVVKGLKRGEGRDQRFIEFWVDFTWFGGVRG